MTRAMLETACSLTHTMTDPNDPMDPAAQARGSYPAQAVDLEDFRPVNQLEVKFKLKAKDGTEINQEFQCSVNVVPGGVAVR